MTIIDHRLPVTSRSQPLLNNNLFGRMAVNDRQTNATLYH